ncbi:HAMP domain-containing sensor histidine kinase [Polaromonas sp.]|uniref:sensor histidine kinase n=1 Tax=Polaromonas sp. TaxID=1869339 RepID=UPI0013B8F154|nr:HAMP domain-containing sensor histidine kinase [Polaromonas sp.]NDP64165.1 HAMP domain-containing histidine kinase [Polaromonas sp.]
MTPTDKTHAPAGFGLVWLNCLAAHAGEPGRESVGAQGKLLWLIEPAPFGGWPTLLLVMMAVFCCTLPFLYRRISRLFFRVPAFARKQADLLVQARQEVGQLEALLELRADALQTAWLSAYEAHRDRVDLLGCINSQLQEQADEIRADARAMVRAAAGVGAHENIILRSANRLHGLAEALLAYSLEGTQAHELTPGATSLGAWLKGLAAEAEAMAKINGNCLDFSLETPLAPGIHIDRSRVRQVLLELFHNSAKFTRNGRITFKIELLRRSDGALALVFTVQDTGQGMGSSDLQKIFEPFARFSHTDDGHAAGLVMALHWARLMDGELAAASEAGQGTTLKFTVPAKYPAVGPDAHCEPQEPVAKLDMESMSATTVSPDAKTLAHLAGLVSIGAISDLMDWAHGPEARTAAWSRFACVVAELAEHGNLQGLSALLADAERVERPVFIDPGATSVAPVGVSTFSA